MWFLRVLTGKLQGQLFPLKEGKNILGRDASCSIQFLVSHISKKHAEIDLKGKSLTLRDLNSRNGVLVDEKKIQSHPLKMGEKILLHDVMMDVVYLKPFQESGSAMQVTTQKNPSTLPENNLSHFPSSSDQMGEAHAALAPEDPSTFPMPFSGKEKDKESEEDKNMASKSKNPFFKKYLEEGFLPGLYKLMEWMGFQGGLSFLVALFILFFSFLSFIPLIYVFKSQTLKESEKRALSVARSLSALNKEAILSGRDLTVDVSFAQRESGVEQAFIISSEDGLIIAPSLHAGKHSKLPFVHSERKKNHDFIQNIEGNRILALSPISEYDPKLNLQKAKAHSVVVYNLKTLSLKNERFLSFFIQILFISLLSGALLIFILLKFIDHPIEKVNHEIDQALKEGHTNIEFPYTFPQIEKLVSNVRSALNRISYNQEENNLNTNSTTPHYDRHQERESLVQLIGYPAATFFIPEQKFGPANDVFAEKVGLESSEVNGFLIENLRDESLKLNILDLLQKLQEQPEQLAFDQLEFSGKNYQIAVQAIFGDKEMAYALIVFLPMNEEEG